MAPVDQGGVVEVAFDGNDKLKQVSVLIEAFRMERIIYIILTSLSALSLMAIGVYLALFKDDMASFLALMAPTGTLTLCIFRVLKMWDDAIKFISENKTNE